MPHNVGYCCINTELSSQGITTGRGMIKRTFQQKGIDYASELALQNSEDLIKIIQWNVDHNIKVFRMGSGIFPWASEYDLTNLKDYKKIVYNLKRAGDLAIETGQRVTAHPDHFVKLASKKIEVVKNSIKELELHSTVFDLMGLSTTVYNAINIHVGMNFSKDTADHWVKNFKHLSVTCQNRMTVENDDKASGFSVKQLSDHIFNQIGIPITFDYFHHEFHPDGLTAEEAARLAAGTWHSEIIPLFHYSESKNLNENVSGNPRAHADFVFNKIDDFGLTLDIDLEAKAKEQALFKYRSLV